MNARRHLPILLTVIVLLIILIVLAAAFIYSGIYNIGADAPHSGVVYETLETLRDKSIDRHASGVAVPNDRMTSGSAGQPRAIA